MDLVPSFAFNGYVGQTETVDNLIEYYEDYQAIGTFPHTLFCWPYGCGKTEIARRVAKMIDPSWIPELGEINAGSADMTAWYRFWANLPFTAVVVDEIQDMSEPMNHSLRDMMLNGQVRTNYTNSGMERQTYNVVILGAGTDRNKIHEHVRSRFGFQPSFVPYSSDEISSIFRLMAGETKLPDDVLSTLVRTCLGEPRQISHLVKACRSVARRGEITLPAVLKKASRTDDGLDADAKRLIMILGEQGGKVALPVLSALMGFDKKAVEDIERIPIKLLYLTRQGGRTLTDYGYARYNAFLAEDSA